MRERLHSPVPVRTSSRTQAMASGGDLQRKPPHIAFFPSVGMGHLLPFLRLAAMVASRGCLVTLIAAKPAVSAAEAMHVSTFLSAYPQIKSLEFEVLPHNPNNSPVDDPFYRQFIANTHSAHLLKPLLLSSSPPLSAIFSDFTVTMSSTPIADDLRIPNYIVCTTSARFLSLMAFLPPLFSDNPTRLFDSDNGNIDILGLYPVLISSIPLPVFTPDHPFSSLIASNARSFHRAKALFLNTFDQFEYETIAALNSGRVLSDLPPILPVGPFKPTMIEQGYHLPWLDDQSAGSVVYVSFGSRTALLKDQIMELGKGLERSGCAFLWVLKARKVDKEDNEELEELLGDPFLERIKHRGIVVKGWVKQAEILAHPAIGGFLSHCGWNSVMEAARYGVPILAWPQHGDQKVNAEVAENAGLGVWIRQWGWSGEKLVKGEEIGEKVREIMSNEKLREKAMQIGKEAREAFEANGSSEKALMGVINALKHA